MARKKKHEEHVNHERWLVSYADFITLLFATFTMLFAISNADKQKYAELAKSLKNSFATNQPTEVRNPSLFGTALKERTKTRGFIDIFKEDSAPGGGKLNRHTSEKDGSGDEDFAPSGTQSEPETEPDRGFRGNLDIGGKPPDQGAGFDEAMKGMGTGGEGVGGDPRVALSRQLSDIVEKEHLEQSIDIRRDERGVVVSLDEAVFYEPESTYIKAEAAHKLDRILEMLKERGHRLMIEGHTNNEPLKSGRYTDHLELSSLRASRLASFMISQYGFSPDLISAAGFGAGRPVASNATERGRRANQRVDIVIRDPEKQRK